MYATISEVRLRIKERFRDRAQEWQGAFIMIGWGLVTISFPDTFNSPAFNAAVFDLGPYWWGGGMVFAGIIRVVALCVNGYFSKATAWARVVSAVVGAAFFFALFAGLMLSGQHPPPGAAVYAVLAAFCILSV